MDQPQASVLEQQIRELAALKEDDLYRKLGAQMRQATYAQENNPVALQQALEAGAFAEAEGAEMGLGEDLREFGRRWWSDMEPRLYALLCTEGNQDRAKVLAMLPADKGGQAAAGSSKSPEAIAAILAPLLITALPFHLPILAAAIGVIAAKTILASGLTTTCEMWGESMAQKAQTGAATASTVAPAATGAAPPRPTKPA